MGTHSNVFLTRHTTVTCHDGPEAPYLVIDQDGDHRGDVTLFLGHAAAVDELSAATAQLDTLERAIAQARRLIAIRLGHTAEPDDDEDDDVDGDSPTIDLLGATWSERADHMTDPAPAAAPADDDNGAGPATFALDGHVGQPGGPDSPAAQAELVTTYSYRQAHPMTELEARASWGDR